MIELSRHLGSMIQDLIGILSLSLSNLDLRGYKYIGEGGVLKVSRGVLFL